ncbi:MAG TPA: UbiA family prenyltransferase [Chitinivibrionales bacterium]|nr:UbiA family prenyltransferase [Chitinivibrionales bacterium]
MIKTPITRSSIEHIRLPFSFFLLPIFLLALVSAGAFDPVKAWIVFFVLHFLLYTASNGFNSFYDRDRESIGALRRPLPVAPDLLWFSLALDAAAVLAAFFVGWRFALGCFIYGLASKAYSWNTVRIKRHPVVGWLWAGIGQGTFTFLLVVLSVNNMQVRDLAIFRFLFPATATGLFLLGIFPLTQIYQHREDARRGDVSISLFLGIKKTMTLAAVLMAAGLTGFFYFFLASFGVAPAAWFAVASLPAAIYFVFWFFAVLGDEKRADFDRTMLMNLIASGGLNLWCVAMLLLEAH